ncbi:Mu-like prophage major head subunit gpT family protein [Sorangium sp. So ce834]|uniref:Mu-like prophage major head subunit gpT family protein n=1 Tax=Sorangium sp. So ce834 TaxID=3133321 RepID=UPI003F5E2A65
MLWTINHVLNTEARLTKLQADSFALALRNVWYDRLMTVRPGEGARQVFEWLLTTAQIYKLDDGNGLRFDDLMTQSTEVVHDDYGVGLKIKRKQWEDDAFGFAGDWARQIGSAMALDPQYALITLMQNGETSNGYDGQAFYSKAHPINPFIGTASGTYDNLIDDMNDIDSSFANATNPALNSANLVAAIAYIKTIKMPNGKNRNLRPAVLRIPPQLEKTGIELTSAAFIGATENVIRNYQLDTLVVNELGNAPTHWYLDCLEGETPELLPFVRFARMPFEMTSYNGMTQAELSRKFELEWHVRGRFGHMYGHPYQSFKFKGSGP